MTREQLNKHWNAIVAFKKGESVQEWSEYTNRSMGGWSCDLEDPKFDLDKEYRIVPRRFDYDYSPNFLAGFLAALINCIVLLLIYLITKDEVMFFFMFVGGGVLFMIFTALYPKKIYRK